MKCIFKKLAFASTLAIVSAVVTGCMTSYTLHEDDKIAAPGSGGLRWRVSCESPVQRLGADTFKFVTSKNTCTINGKISGTFQQRNEINTNKFSIDTIARYTFETNIRLISDNNDEVFIFQIHDATVPGCAPPLSIGVTEKSIRLTSAYKYRNDNVIVCNGLSFHDEDRFGVIPNIDLIRDGTEYNFRVEVDFLGRSAFDVEVYIDDELVVGGRYEPAVNDKNYIKSKSYYFKHGVYSRYIFDYEMYSRGLRLKRVAN